MKKLLLFGTLLISSLSISQLNVGLIAQYDFSGDALDASGNNNDGTVSGATLVNDRNGNPSTAYNFDGTDDNIIVAGFPTNYDHYSYCAWVQADSLAQSEKAICMQLGLHTGLNASIVSFGLGTTTSNPSYYGRHRFDDNSLTGAGDNNILDLNWHFIVSTYDGDSLKFYVDGVFNNFNLVNTSAAKIDSLFIGCGRAFGVPFGYYFKGTIDDIRIYNRELTDCEIEELYSGVNPCNVGIDELTQVNKELFKIIDFMGRETEYKPNTPLIFIYSDGTRERVMKLEE